MMMRGFVVAAALGVVLGASPASATPILVSQGPWGQDTDADIMDNVFGAGNWTFYNSYASATPASIFTPATSFVFLEGGNGTDTDWQAYVNANAATILSWVNAGGALLLMSADWSDLTTTLGPGTLTGGYYSFCGTLTPAGVSAFLTTAANQCGNYISHNIVTGTGLTSFMTGDGHGFSIVAGTLYGAGYIMYSGLTDYQWHTNGPSLLNDIVAFTARQVNPVPVPEPASLLLFGTGLLAIVVRARQARR